MSQYQEIRRQCRAKYVNGYLAQAMKTRGKQEHFYSIETDSSYKSMNLSIGREIGKRSSKDFLFLIFN